MFSAEKIKKLFDSNNVKYVQSDILDELMEYNFAKEIYGYFKLMGSSLKIHENQYGSSKTWLDSQKEILAELKDDANKHITNDFIIIGAGANGDLLCISKSTGEVAYVFHDIFLEDPNTEFENMSVKLNMKFDEFLEMVFSGEQYPVDGYDAEDYIKKQRLL